jgi:acetate kinase
MACFDTAFHQDIPAIDRRFALPRRYHDEGLKRYGFHGLSYEYIASILPEKAAERAKGRIVVAHLGGGSSACAIKNLKSIGGTMGFSTLDGMMMGTRCGSMPEFCSISLKKKICERKISPGYFTRNPASLECRASAPR